MLSISKPLSASSAGKYYKRDDYYLQSDGVWHGKGALALNLDGEIFQSDFELILNGVSPDGERIIRNSDKENHRSGIDLTFSAPKSVSVLSFSDNRIKTAFDKALNNTLDFTETNFAHTRQWIGKKERVVVKTDNMIFAKFNHMVSRETDPQLHTHVVAMNMTQREDGGWVSLHNDKLYKNKILLGQHFRNELALQIKELGYKIEVTDRKQGFFEIKGFSSELIQKFSKRREEVLAKQKELKADIPQLELLAGLHGKIKRMKESEVIERANSLKSDPESLRSVLKTLRIEESPQSIVSNKEKLHKAIIRFETIKKVLASDEILKELSALGSRKMKKDITFENVMLEVENTLLQSNTSFEKIKSETLDLNRKTQELVPAEHLEALIGKITELKSSVTREDIIEYAVKFGDKKYTAQEYEKSFELMREKQKAQMEHLKISIDAITESQSVFTREDVLKIAMKFGIGEHTAKDYEKSFEIMRKRQEVQFLSSEKSMTGSTNMYSTKRMIALEEDIIRMCNDGKSKSKVVIDSKECMNFIKEENAKLLKSAPEKGGFTLGQMEAIKQIASSKDNISVIQGDAGTGKSFSMYYARDMLEKQGFTVKGFAPTGKAAEELNSSSKIKECVTLDSFLLKAKNTKQRDSLFKKNKECWIIDETGMSGSTKTHDFLKLAKEANAKVIFVGDRKQFASIEAGKIFSEIQDKTNVDITIMEDVMRQETKQIQQIVSCISAKNIELAFDLMEGRVLNDKEKEFINYKDSKFADGNEPVKLIKEVESRNHRLESISNEYLKSVDKGEDTMIITGANVDRNDINKQIRAGLITKGKIKDEKEYDTWLSANLSGATARFADSYKKDQIVFVSGKIEGIKNGTQAKISERNITDNSITLEYFDKATQKTIKKSVDLTRDGTKLSTFNSVNKNFGVGERIVFLKNDKEVGVKNGQIGKILGIDKQGNCQVDIGKAKNPIIKTFNINGIGEKPYKYLDHAYALTEYKSQGATVDKLIWNADTNKNISFNSFYVAVTRCKRKLSVYTDDKRELITKSKEEQKKLSTLDYNDLTKKNKENKIIYVSKIFTAKNGVKKILSGESFKRLSERARERFFNKRNDLSVSHKKTVESEKHI